MAEILNIEYHTKRLLLKALNQERSQARAAVLLGVTERTVARMVKLYKLKKDRKAGTYSLQEETNFVTVTLVS